MLHATFVILSFCVQDPVQPHSLADLIHACGHDDPSARERATDEIVHRWHEWKSADVALLRAATSKHDVELAARASQALRRVLDRRVLNCGLARLVPPVTSMLHGEAPVPMQRITELVVAFRKAGLAGDRDLAAWAGFCTEGVRTDLDLTVIVEMRERSCASLAPLLESALRGDAREKRLAAIATGRVMRATVLAPCIEDLLGHPDVDTVVEASTTLGVVRWRPAISRIAWLCGHANNRVRLAAVDALRLLNARECLDDIMELLTDADDGVRRAAGEATEEWLPSSDLARFRKHLRHVRPEVRSETAGAIGRLQDATAIADLLSLLEDPVPRVRRSACHALALLGATSAAPRVASLADDPDADVRRASLTALTRIATAETAPTLARLASKGAPHERSLAIEALALLPDAFTREAIVAALGDAEASVRRVAVDALVRSGRTDLTPILELVSRDADSGVLAAACDARIALGYATSREARLEVGAPGAGRPVPVQERAAVGELLRHFDESDLRENRLEAVRTLGRGCTGALTVESRAAILERLQRTPIPREAPFGRHTDITLLAAHLRIGAPIDITRLRVALGDVATRNVAHDVSIDLLDALAARCEAPTYALLLEGILDLARVRADEPASASADQLFAPWTTTHPYVVGRVVPSLRALVSPAGYVLEAGTITVLPASRAAVLWLARMANRKTF